MVEKVLLSKYFKAEDIVAKEDQIELKPSSKGLIRLKEKLGIADWEMLYVGDGYDDYLAAKGANVFFCMIAQGLVEDMAAIRGMKNDASFGGAYYKRGRRRLPKFMVAFTYQDILWWFEEFADFRRQIKAVCFDLGDTLIVGGREEAYLLTDKNWPTWDVDSLLDKKEIPKKLRDSIMKIKIGNRWRKLGSLPAMNSSEVRIASYFLLEVLGLKEKDLVSVLYSDVTKTIKSHASSIAKEMKLALNTNTLADDATIKGIAGYFPPEQFTVFIAAGLLELQKSSKNPPKEKELALILQSAFIWIKEYRKYEIEAYKKHCKVPKGLQGLLDYLKKRKRSLCIYTSKSRNIVESSISFEKEISQT